MPTVPRAYWDGTGRVRSFGSGRVGSCMNTLFNTAYPWKVPLKQTLYGHSWSCRLWSMAGGRAASTDVAAGRSGGCSSRSSAQCPILTSQKILAVRATNISFRLRCSAGCFTFPAKHPSLLSDMRVRNLYTYPLLKKRIDFG